MIYILISGNQGYGAATDFTSTLADGAIIVTENILFLEIDDRDLEMWYGDKL